jgi:dihydropteroate synthase
MKDLKFGKKPLVMGILNVTPDSFSDGGKFLSVDEAVNHAIKMEEEGADIIDVGGESTRPGAKSVSINKEISRVIPVIKKLVEKISIPISVDTYKSEVAQKTLDIGVSMINDITALRGDGKLVEVVAKYDVPICLMHMKGTPKNMQLNPEYEDVVQEIKKFLKERARYAKSKGIKKKNIIVDPGLGFGKRTGKGIEDNLEILNRLAELKDLGYPIMIGASRKTFIGNFFGGGENLPVYKRLEGSLAAAVVAIVNGANIIRVHDVKETKNIINFVDG